MTPLSQLVTSGKYDRAIWLPEVAVGTLLIVGNDLVPSVNREVLSVGNTININVNIIYRYLMRKKQIRTHCTYYSKVAGRVHA